MDEAVYRELYEKYKDGTGVYELAAAHGVTPCTIYNHFRTLGLPVRKLTKPMQISKEKALEMFEDYKSGATLYSIAKHNHMAAKTIRIALEYYGIPIQALNQAARREKVLSMYEDYKRGMKYDEIAEKYGYAGANSVGAVLFVYNDFPRLGRPERRKALYDARSDKARNAENA